MPHPTPFNKGRGRGNYSTKPSFHFFFSSFTSYSNGSEWWRLRSEFQKGLSSPTHIRQFLSDSDSITKEFLANIQQGNNTTKPQVIEDILPELSRLNLECKLNSFSLRSIFIHKTWGKFEIYMWYSLSFFLSLWSLLLKYSKWFATWHSMFEWIVFQMQNVVKHQDQVNWFKRPKIPTVVWYHWIKEYQFGVWSIRQCIENFHQLKNILKG